MTDYQNPLLNWLVVKHTTESELRLELETREILNTENLKEVRWFCASLYKENWAKDQVIKNCLGRIGELEAQLVVIQMDQEKSCFTKLLRKVIPRRTVKVQSFED
jgi:hypothetical protein